MTETLKKEFKKLYHMTQVKLRWSPFKRFGVFGRLLSKIGMVPSYFMQSHFNLVLNFDSGND